jgi:tRNA(Ile)-lysidine synthase
MLPVTPVRDYRLLEPFFDRSRDARPRLKGASLPECVIIRPLLAAPRSDVEKYCADHSLTPRFDRSNLDITCFRNRLRHELLPMLEVASPNLRARLCNTASVVAADYEVLTRLQHQAWADLVLEERDAAVVLDQAAWQELPVSLQRATLRKAAYSLRDTLRDVNFVHIEHARQVALNGETGAQATLPMGLALTIGYGTLTVGDVDDAGPPPDGPLLWSDGQLPVRVPGTTQLSRSKWVLNAHILEAWDSLQIASNADRWVAYLDAAAISPPLVLRRRASGDRFRPLGMGGNTVKLSAFLINRKVPRRWRDRIPLLVADDEIVWVCGHRQADIGLVGSATQKVIRLQFDLAP